MHLVQQGRTATLSRVHRAHFGNPWGIVIDLQLIASVLDLSGCECQHGGMLQVL